MSAVITTYGLTKQFGAGAGVFKLDLLVPAGAMEARLDAVVAAGGRVIERRDGRATVGDADGAIAVVVAG